MRKRVITLILIIIKWGHTMALQHCCFQFSNKSIFGPILDKWWSYFHWRYQSSALLFFFLFAGLSAPLFCRRRFPELRWRDSPFAWRFPSRMSQPILLFYCQAWDTRNTGLNLGFRQFLDLLFWFIVLIELKCLPRGLWHFH